MTDSDNVRVQCWNKSELPQNNNNSTSSFNRCRLPMRAGCTMRYNAQTFDEQWRAWRTLVHHQLILFYIAPNSAIDAFATGALHGQVIDWHCPRSQLQYNFLDVERYSMNVRSVCFMCVNFGYLLTYSLNPCYFICIKWKDISCLTFSSSFSSHIVSFKPRSVFRVSSTLEPLSGCIVYQHIDAVGFRANCK